MAKNSDDIKRWQGRTRLGKNDQARGRRIGSFVVVELEDRRSGKIWAVYQEIGGGLRCTCPVWKHNQDCRHVEIVEVARTLAACWAGASSDVQTAAILRLTPPPGDAKPTRLYADDDD